MEDHDLPVSDPVNINITEVCEKTEETGLICKMEVPELPTDPVNIEEIPEQDQIEETLVENIVCKVSPSSVEFRDSPDHNHTHPVLDTSTPLENGPREFEEGAENGNEILKTSVVEVPMEKLVGRHVLRHILETGPPLDTILSCSDGKLGAHRAVLVSASPFLGFILSRRVAGELATIVLPDISLATMTAILTLCYTGEMTLSKDKEEEVYSAMEVLMIGVEADFTLCSKPVKKKKESSPELRPDVAEPKGDAVLEEGTKSEEIIPVLNHDPDVDVESTSSRGTRDSSSTKVSSKSVNPSSSKTSSKTSSETSASKTSPKPKKGRPSKARAKPGPKSKCKVGVEDESKSTPCTRSTKVPASTTTTTKSKGVKVKNPSTSTNSGNKQEVAATTSAALKNQNATAKKSFCGIMLEGGNHVCLKCDGILPNTAGFKSHLCVSHGSFVARKEVSSSEMKELFECGICGQKYSSLSRASSCLKAHGFSKCYTCFGLIISDQLASHYVSVHGMRTSFALVSRCRWCDLAVDIGKCATKPQSHAVADHISRTWTAPEQETKDLETAGKKKDGGNKAAKRKRSVGKESLEESGSSRRSASKSRSSQLSDKSLIPFLKRSGQPVEKEALTATATATPRPPSKKRKLDERGRPLQLSKRTGGSSSLSRKKLFQDKSDTAAAASTGFCKDPPSFVTNPDTGQVVGLSLGRLPHVRVRLEELLNMTDLYSFLKKIVPEEVAAGCSKSDFGQNNGSQPTTTTKNDHNHDHDHDLNQGKSPNPEFHVDCKPFPAPSATPTATPTPTMSTPNLSTTTKPLKNVQQTTEDWNSKIILSGLRGGGGRRPPPEIKMELPSPSFPEGSKVVVPPPAPPVPSSNSTSTPPNSRLGVVASPAKRKTVELICIDDEEDEGYDFPMLSNNESLIPLFSFNEVLDVENEENICPGAD